MPDQAVLPLFEEHRGDWLAAARQIARRLGADGREVTIDDVRTELPPPSHLDPRVMGAVFRQPEWQVVRYQSSKRSTCHRRPVAVFRLAAREASHV